LCSKAAKTGLFFHINKTHFLFTLHSNGVGLTIQNFEKTRMKHLLFLKDIAPALDGKSYKGQSGAMEMEGWK